VEGGDFLGNFPPIWVDNFEEFTDILKIQLDSGF